MADDFSAAEGELPYDAGGAGTVRLSGAGTVNSHIAELRERGLLEMQYDDPVQQREAATLGMWVFLSTEILFFGVLFASYTICRVLYPHGFAAASRETDMLLGSIETAVLLVSSTLVALAVRAIKLDQRTLAAWLLAGTAALGVTFLTMHGFEYHKEYTEHLIPGLTSRAAGRRSEERRVGKERRCRWAAA